MLRWACLFFLCSAAFAAPGEIVSRYGETAHRLLDAATADEHSLDRLEYLCDRIGNRLSGSPSLERAVLWSAEEMKRAGLKNVRIQPVKVPHWVRGAESLSLVSPEKRNLPILGIGNSIGTPAEGITAEVVAVSTFDELAALPPERVKGRIVLFDAPYQGYGKTVAYRVGGASRAPGKTASRMSTTSAMAAKPISAGSAARSAI